MSDSSEFISDISEESNSNNDRFGVQKVLSPEQIFDMMQSEIRKICEVTNNVSECQIMNFDCISILLF